MKGGVEMDEQETAERNEEETTAEDSYDWLSD